jgi:aldehyde dehydrogenase (NAD+)
MLTKLSTSNIINQQRSFFSTYQTKDIAFRIAQLKKLKVAILEHESDIYEALRSDLRKPEVETYGAEISLVIEEINYTLKNLKKWTKSQKVPTSKIALPASSKIYQEPKGVVLIIGTWNYPFQLLLAPLVPAIAAGNCATLKPSDLAPNTSSVVAKIFAKHFDPAFISVIEGGIEISQELLAEKFDHIFFTGSTVVGKIIMQAAAKNLTPVTLELGGKSPCIVDSDTHIEYSARRIIWGKFTNAGQTCVAPDYVLVDQKIKTDLLAAMQKCLKEFYGENPQDSPDYGRIINTRHFNRLGSLIKDGDIIIGGQTDIEDHYISPTIIDNISWEDAVMQEEIFGPILPVIEYTDIEEAIAAINARPKPLALYVFTNNKDLQQKVLKKTSSGGLVINDVVIHLAVLSLPFGGIGDSGMGSYHGKAGFDTFSHYKSLLKNNFLVDIKLRYAPYKGKLPLLKKILG